jgi:hypothetical protein
VFGTAKFKPNKIPSLKKNAFYGQYNNTKFSEKSFFLEFVHSRQLSPPPEKCQLSYDYLAPTSVGRKISAVGDRGTVGYRWEWQESLRNPSGRKALIIYGRFLAMW